ncbi:MAG: ABC-F family ATP-binding cassette domain-containing protein [Aquiluna sp.]|nr:ABC-F family ATP-binding cassette domain-containing protein [Aquiluna sp.]
MAHLMGAESIRHEFPTKEVFSGVTVGINEGDRIGIVGRNGDGKSTLLKILTKQFTPDEGRVTWRSDIRVGFLTQVDALNDENTIAEAVVGDTPEHEWASDPKIREVLSGLLGDLDWHQKVGPLSGGQRRRVALAVLLAGDFDVLYLDEPTNHLDVDGVAWLAGHLKTRWPKSMGGLVVITHDRWFLDAVCNLTWEVYGGKIEPFEGGYAAYVQQRAERSRQAAVIETRRQNLLRKELAWLGRGAPARTAKPKFRIDAALELIGNEPPPRNSVELAKLATTRLGKDVLDMEDVSYSFPDGLLILDDLTFRLGPGDRVGFVGANGVGKTTLMKLITGELLPQSGRVKIGKTVKFAKLSQDVHELDKHSNERIFDLIRREKTTFMVGKKEVGTGQLLEQLGFDQQQLQTPIKDLSGGQRRRLQLLRLLFGEPNVLILDEPTNDLDTDMLAAIEDLLDSWPGTLIVVSHDRYLLERVTDNQYAMLGDGKLRHLTQGVEQYLSLRKGIASGSSGSATSVAVSQVSGAEKRNLEKELARLERAIQKNKSLLADLSAQLASTDPSDFEELVELGKKQQETGIEVDSLEELWLDVAQKLQVD